MADVSLPGDTGALMVYDAEDPREEREGGNPNLRTLRKQQSKARKKSRELATSSRAQVDVTSHVLVSEIVLFEIALGQRVTQFKLSCDETFT